MKGGGPLDKFQVVVKFDDETETYRAAGTATGRAVVRVFEDVRCELSVCHEWRAEGYPITEYGNRTRRFLFEGEWKAGEHHEYAFELPLPTWPASYQGLNIAVNHFVTTEVTYGASRMQDETRRLITVLGSSETVERVARRTPIHTSATQHSGSGACSAAMLFFVAGTFALVRSYTPSAALTAGSVAFSLLALVPLVLTLRNTIAERRIGKVFVGIEPTVYAGRALACLVRFQPGSSVTVNGVEAEIVCVEKAGPHPEQTVGSFSRTRFSKRLVVSQGRSLSAGEVLEAEQAFKIPDDAPPSLRLSRASVDWKVKLRVDIADWPDWVHSYPILVFPSTQVSVHSKTQVRLTRVLQVNQVCPYCRDTVTHENSDGLTTCAECNTVFHLECMRELGRCTTRGCRRSGLRA
jgi:hypothetical protein